MTGICGSRAGVGSARSPMSSTVEIIDSDAAAADDDDGEIVDIGDGDRCWVYHSAMQAAAAAAGGVYGGW